MCALLGALSLFALTVSAQDLYWTEEEVIMASDIDGSNVTQIFDGTGMGGYAVDIVVSEDHLYWTDHAGSSSEGGIWRADRDGSNAELFVENDGSFSAPHYLVISEVHGKIYFSCYSNGLFQVDLDTGDNLEVLFDGFPAATFTGMALRGDNDEELIWFAAASDNDAIYRTQLPSGNTPQGDVILDVEGGGATYGMAYDPAGDLLYFTNFGTGTLYRFDFATRESVLLRDGLSGPLGLKFSPSFSHLLIAERGRGVSAYQIDNFGFELLVDASAAHFGVAVTADPADLPDGEPPAEPEEGDVIFATGFEDDEPGALPREVGEGGVWSSVSAEPEEGTVMVMQDEENVFRAGTDNRFVRYESVNDFSMQAAYPAVEVATLSFDVITRFHEGDSGRWVNARMRAGGTDAHITSLRNSTRAIRADEVDDPVYADPDVPVRISTVVNNSTETITYTGPDGEEYGLSPEFAAAWVYDYFRREWTLLLPEYQSHSAASAGEVMDNFWLQIDSNDPLRSFDFDNFSIIKGAVIPEPASFEHPEPLYTLQSAWEVGPDDSDYLTDENRERGMTYNPATGNVLIAHRGAEELAVAAIDGASGDPVGTLSTEGIEGGIFPLNHVAAAEDGAIYGANLTRDAGGTQDGPLKVYRWENEQADPVLVYEGDPSRGDQEEYEDRFGDTMAVRGSGLETQILMAPRFGKNVTILTPDGSMDAFVDNLIVTDIPTSPAGWLTHGLAFGEGDRFFGTRQPQFGSTTSQRGLVEVEFDLEEETGTVVRILEPTVFPNDVGPIGLDLDRGFLVGLDSYAHEDMDPRQPEALLYDLSALSEDNFNFSMDIERFGPGNLNGNGSGQVIFGDNGRVYVLDTNNGVAAFDVVETVDALTFASWMDGLPDEERPPEGQRGPLDEPAGDGIPNVLKYALGLSPMTPGTRDLPIQEVRNLEVDGEQADYLTLTFTRPNAVGDVDYEVEAGGDLAGWPDSAVLVDELTTDNGDGTTTYTYRDLQPIEDSDRRFLRLSVELLE